MSEVNRHLYHELKETIPIFNNCSRNRRKPQDADCLLYVLCSSGERFESHDNFPKLSELYRPDSGNDAMDKVNSYCSMTVYAESVQTWLMLAHTIESLVL